MYFRDDASTGRALMAHKEGVLAFSIREAGQAAADCRQGSTGYRGQILVHPERATEVKLVNVLIECNEEGMLSGAVHEAGQAAAVCRRRLTLLATL